MLNPATISAAIKTYGPYAVIKACDDQMLDGGDAMAAQIGLEPVTMGDVIRAMWAAQDHISGHDRQRMLRIEARRTKLAEVDPGSAPVARPLPADLRF